MKQLLLEIWIYLKWAMGTDLKIKADFYKLQYGKKPNKQLCRFWREKSWSRAVATGGQDYSTWRTLAMLSCYFLIFGLPSAAIIVMLMTG